MNTSDEDYLFDPDAPPDAAIVALEAELASLRGIDVGPRPGWADAGVPIARGATWTRRTAWLVGTLIAAGLLLTATQLSSRLMRPWTVVQLSQVRGALHAPIASARTVGIGDVIVTDSLTTMRLNVGTIGRTEIRPGSRVRVVATGATHYRLALDEGEIHARIWAPPRFFLVETPNALAVDLGCIYTLRSAADGSGFLRVESGEVELATSASIVRVPAGNIVHINSSGLPGLPFPASSALPLRSAISSYEANPKDVELVRAILRNADSTSSIVLWHLLSRVPAEVRGEVYERLAAVAPLSLGISRGAGHERALDELRAALEPGWSTERAPLWKRWWRGLWRGNSSG